MKLVCSSRKTSKETPVCQRPGLNLSNLGNSHRISTVSEANDPRACLDFASWFTFNPVPRAEL